MKTILHTADSRGHANHGWLESRHTFSFAGYHDPERTRFGLLRVLNDDVVTGGAGFGTHPHDNMEIISIPLSGDLEHKDSMGNVQVIRQGDVQVMSAGTGIFHSEYNKNAHEPVNFLQIWVFPKERNIEPRYGQKTFSPEARRNTWQTVVAPDDPAAVWINQDAWFHLARPEKGEILNYTLRSPDSGVYLFMISGEASVAGQELSSRDGLGVWETNRLEIEALSEAEILLMEVPHR